MRSSLRRLLLFVCFTAAAPVRPVFALPFAYIPGHDKSVTVIDTATNLVVATIKTTGSMKGAAVSDTGAVVYATQYGGDRILVIDAATNALIKTIALGPFPIGFPEDIVFSAPLQRLYVSSGIDRLLVIDASTNTYLTDIPLTVDASEIRGVAITPDGSKVYATRFTAGDVYVVDTATNTVTTSIPATGTNGIIVDSTGTTVYTTYAIGSVVNVIDVATDAVTSSIPVGICGPNRLVLDPTDSTLYVTCQSSDQVKVIDVATETVTDTISVGDAPIGIDKTPDGSRLYVVNFSSNNVSVIDTGTNTVIDTIAVGEEPIGRGRFIGPASDCGDGVKELGEECDDGGTTPGDGCDATCQREPDCTAVVACSTPEKSVLVLKDESPDDDKNRVTWKWIKGTATTADFGDPLGTTDYEFCILDDGVIAVSAYIEGGGACGAKDCWKTLGPSLTPKGFKYLNKYTNSDGASLALLKEGAGKAKLLWKGKGGRLPLPAPVGLSQYFNQTTDVTVRLRRTDGSQCWEAVFTSNKTNSGDLFKAVTP